MAKRECSNCGAQIEENVKFCTECGSKMEQEELKCPSCSAQLPKDTKFCTECGTKIETAPKEVICPKCRKKLSANLKFCTECGTRLGLQAPEKKSHDDEVDKLIKEAKDTGKGLLKEADGLLKKFTR
ncbi:MAG: zinc ribbon domain-containing protein [Methanobacterium sp.]|nr:zinc ribbon domain-containing protein [Methanobacterium sp.]